MQPYLAVMGHVPGAGLGAAVRELAGWRLARGSGWATLAAAVLTAAEDAGWGCTS
jgi:hypothetical protein